MKNKIIIGMFFVALFTVAFGIAEFVSLKKQPIPVAVLPPQPIATTTQPTPMPQAPIAMTPPASPSTCNTSAGQTSTSTWKTFADPKWEITFQYPPNWDLEQGNTAGGELYLAISRAENLFDVVVNPSRSFLDEDGTYTSCNRVVAGKNIGVTIDPYRHSSSTFRYVTSINRLVFDMRGPLSSTEIMNAILNSIVLVKN